MPKSTVSNLSIGLDTEKSDGLKMNASVMKFVARKQMAPVPTVTVGRCNTLRREILQLSLFPDIYDKVKKVHHPGNVDFGESD